MSINAVFPTASGGSIRTPVFSESTITGGNPLLQPEESVNISFGIDYSPNFIPGLTLRASKYDIDYDNRIEEAFSRLFSITNPQLEFPNLFDFVDDNNDSIDDPTDGNGQLDFGERLLTIDIRAQNIARVETSGFDYGLEYNLSTDIGEFWSSITVAEISSYVQTDFPESEPEEQINSIRFPKYRTLGQLGWSHRGLDVSLSGRHTQETVATFQDVVDPSVIVTSITKFPIVVNLQVAYDFEGGLFGSNPGIFGNTQITAGINNLFDSVFRNIQDNGSERQLLPVSYVDPRNKQFYIELTKSF